MSKHKRNSVFIVPILSFLIMGLWAFLSENTFEHHINTTLSYLLDYLGWFYLLAMSLFVVFTIFIASSKYGKVVLGPKDSKPDYGLFSWFAMLFSAGMGIGLVFWGVAEPLNHYIHPLKGIIGGSQASADFAIMKSFVHWGLHPWANYAVIAMALAYMQFKKNKPGLISSIFIPLIGEELVEGWVGKTIDILAIFATVSGVATSFGLGILQINSGLNYLFNVPETVFTRIIILIILSVAFISSALTGLNKGIKYLSFANVLMALCLLIATIIIGPTLDIFTNLGKGLMDYGVDIVTDINPFGKGEWYQSWTIFYWAWWIAWAPFVGTFIARISKGRTIREFIIGVLLVPVITSFLWFATFGTLGINLGVDIARQAIEKTETALFLVMGQYPMGSFLSIVALILLCTFFVTSADSSTFVLGMMSSKGNLNPSKRNRLHWGILQGFLAVVLMATGGLKMLQTASIIAAFPFAVIMVFAMISLIKVIRSDYRKDQ